MKTFALRLKPGSDLKESLKDFTHTYQLQAGFILTAIGSLEKATLRFANQRVTQVFERKFEVVALSGTLSSSGVHLHIAIADQTGKTLGGHLETGCTIYTTAEIVIGESKEFVFERVIDPETGFKELQILPS